MSTRAIQGKNVLMYITIDGVKLLYACATSITYHINRELIRRTSVGQGSNTKYKYRLIDTTAELQGVTHIIPKDAAYTVFDLIAQMVRGKGIDVQIEFIDGESNYKNITGHALIPDIEITAGADGFSEDTINLQFSGAPGVFNEPPPSQENSNDVDWNIYYGQNGELGITDANLIGRTKVAVFRGGPLQTITTGTPTVQQVKYNSSIGQLLFSVPLGAGEPVFCQWKGSGSMPPDNPPVTTAPALTFVSIPSGQPDKVELLYNKPLLVNTLNTSAFSIAGLAITQAIVTGSKVVLTIYPSFSPGDAPTISYSGTEIKDAAGNSAAVFSDHNIINEL